MTEPEKSAGHGPLQVCARFLSPLDAQVLASCLQNAGINAQVMDGETIFVSGAVFGASADSGVRVMVPESQLVDAMRVRAAYDAGELAIDENYDVGKE